MKLWALWLLLGGLFAGITYPAVAQVNTTKIVCYVEPMPQLIKNGKQLNVVEVIQERLVYPPRAAQKHVTGRVFISFIVTATGTVENAHVVKELRPDCDAAALRAVRQLPRFKPVQQAGKPIASGLTVPVKFSLADTQQLAK